MNVFLYISIVTAIGVALAYGVGRFLWMHGGFASFFLFLTASVFLGVFLSFPLLNAVGSFCTRYGVLARDCINTDDRTVWFLAVPLIAFPLYLLVMFVARTISRSRARKGST
jgi:hypothetical protein